jgi:hypothetical protein
MASAPKQIIEFPPGGAISGTDVMLVQQGPLGTPLTHIQLSALVQQVLGTSGQFLVPLEPTDENVFLSAAEHNERLLMITLPNTFITATAFSALGSGFNAIVWNRSGGEVTFSGTFSNGYGHTRLAAGGVAAVMAATDSSGSAINWSGGPSS